MTFKPDFRNRRDDLPDNYNDLDEAERSRILSERVRLLHIYGQSRWHDEARIVGNRNALTVLRDAIDAALADGSADTSAMVTDGEGYGVEIKLIDQDWQHPEWETQPMPYIEAYASGRPDPAYLIPPLQFALKKANAALVKRGVKPIPEPETP